MQRHRVHRRRSAGLEVGRGKSRHSVPLPCCRRKLTCERRRDQKAYATSYRDDKHAQQDGSDSCCWTAFTHARPCPGADLEIIGRVRHGLFSTLGQQGHFQILLLSAAEVCKLLWCC